jgi:hypothetical protein
MSNASMTEPHHQKVKDLETLEKLMKMFSQDPDVAQMDEKEKSQLMSDVNKIPATTVILKMDELLSAAFKSKVEAYEDYATELVNRYLKELIRS